MRRRRMIVLAAAVVVLAALVAGLVVGVRALYHRVDQHTIAESCTSAGYLLEPDQAVIASQMVGVVLRRDLPERAAVLALAAALQESKLANIPSGEGDRDSVGVLQQRPSQGWGTVAELSDVHFATNAFLDAIVKETSWSTRPLAQVIQAVQRSADGSLYAQHEGEAQALADAFTGRTPAGLTCEFPAPAQVADGSTVSGDLLRDLPVTTPTVSGTTISVSGASWPTTAWFVANADRLGIETVDYGGKRWSRTDGWQPQPAAGRAAVVAVLHT